VSTIGILFFSFIIISYFVGMWAGMKIKKPIVKPPIDNRKNVITPIRRR
jgi:hypothetical protein